MAAYHWTMDAPAAKLAAELGVVRAALNGMDIIENLLLRMRNLALIADCQAHPRDRRALGRQFDAHLRDLDIVAAGTLGVTRANGWAHVCPADFQACPQAVLAVCRADGNGAWKAVCGLPPFARLALGRNRTAQADRQGEIDLTILDDRDRDDVFDMVYDMLNGVVVIGQSQDGTPIALDDQAYPDLGLILHDAGQSWGDVFGHGPAIAKSLMQAEAALDNLHLIAASFGAYVYRLYQRHGFGPPPANEP